MQREKIRPSVADLERDYEKLAFPELEQGAAPAVNVVRTKPPQLGSASSPSFASPSSSAPPKPKSRFALQREREAAERAASSGPQRFEFDFDDMASASAGQAKPSLIGAVKEREVGEVRAPSKDAQPPGKIASLTGFPESDTVRHHRKRAAVPVQPPQSSPVASSSKAGEQGGLAEVMDSVSKENERVLSGMTEEEILAEQKAIREQMGLSEGIIKMLMERGKGKEKAPAPPSATSAFAQARQKAPPAEAQQHQSSTRVEQAEEEEEGSPEYIRRHFFPNEPANPSLDWTKPSTSSSRFTPSFSLSGQYLPSSASSNNTSTGNHHASSSTSFTIPSLLSLTGSSVSAQRTTAFSILQCILSTRDNSDHFPSKEWNDYQLQATAKASRALRDPNAGVKARALDLMDCLLETSLVNTVTSSKPAIDGAEEPATVLSTFLGTEPLQSLASLLHDPSTPRHSLEIILRILHYIVNAAVMLPPATRSSIFDPLLGTAHLLESFSKRLIALPWPPPSNQAAKPDPEAIGLFTLIAQSSKSAAENLQSRNLIEPTLRFVAILPWELDSKSLQASSVELVVETLKLWTTLGRYGIATGLRTKGAELLSPLFASDAQRKPQGPKEGEERVRKAVLELQTIWVTAAVDPHVTGHDILWSHVEEWGSEEVFALQSECTSWELARGLELVAAWVEGSKVNKPRKGEDEVGFVRAKLGKAFEEGGWIQRRVKMATIEAARGTGEEVDLSLIFAAFVLEEACRHAEEAKPLYSIPIDLADSTFDSLLVRRPDRLCERLLTTLLPFLSPSKRFAATLTVIPRLGAGEEIAARDLTGWVVHRVSEAPCSSSSTFIFSDLRPFILHAIVASSNGRVSSPLFPSSRDIKLTSIQHPFAPSKSLLSFDWPLLVLDELLRSGTSKVIESLPSTWDGSELGLVKSALQLMEVIAASGSAPSPPTLMYDLMKVFMLEKDNEMAAHPGAETELFRNRDVTASMQALLRPLAIGSQGAQKRLADTRAEEATLEGVSALVSSAPLYQLYTDFVGLYDSISYGDLIFAKLLLPPLAMAYPVDYRRLLWVDYPQLLKGIKVDVEDAVTETPGSGALSSFLYPVETNEAVLGAYLAALLDKKVTPSENGFLHLIALHHVAQTVFAEHPTAMARRLARALSEGKEKDVIERVTAYDQNGELLRLPPVCWQNKGDRLEALITTENNGT